MIKNIKLLEDETQNIIQLAAAIGNSFNLDILSEVSGKSREYTSKVLWEALKEGIIEPCDTLYKYVSDRESEINPLYKFIHDKVQQASYSMLSYKKKTETHLKIARISSSDIFDTLNHYNKAVDFVTDQNEVKKVFSLNFKAGKRALKSNAYESAFYHLGLTLTLFDRLEYKSKELQLELYIKLLESAYYCGRFKTLDELSKKALQLTNSKIEEAYIYEIVMNAYYTQQKVDDIITKGTKVLKDFNIFLPTKPGLQHILLDYCKTLWKLRRYSIDDLYNLKIMENPNSIAICRILSVMISSAYVSRPDISPLLSLKLVQLSLKYGNYPHSQIYPFFGLLNLLIINRADMCFKYDELGLKLSQREEFRGSRTQNLLMFYAFNYHWTKPIIETIDPLLEGYDIGIENGDLEYACWSLHCSDFAAFFSGYSLDTLFERMVHHQKKMIKHNQFTILYIFSTVLQSLDNLKNIPKKPELLSGNYMDEETLLTSLEGSSLRTTKASIYFWKVILSFMFDKFDEAIDHSTHFNELIDAHAGLSSQPFFYFIYSLSILRVISDKPPGIRLKLMRIIRKNQKLLRGIAKKSPENHKFKWCLVEAEIVRVSSKTLHAQKLYEVALKEVQRNNNIWMKAIAYETYANYFVQLDKSELVHYFLQKVYDSYSEWGALTKVKHMESHYSRYKFDNRSKKNNTSITSSSSSTKTLDLITILKVSKVISSEIKLERLLKKLMEYLIENAGAQKAVLLLTKDNEWFIEAAIEKNSSSLKVLQHIPVFRKNGDGLEEIHVNDNNIIPKSIIKFVIISQSNIILDNAAEEGDFVKDVYVKQHQCKSLLCLPLQNQGKLNGVLFLENNLSSSIFLDDRIEVLNMISSNVSIAIENASMYREVKELNRSLELKVKERTMELEKQSITDRLTGLYNRYKIEKVLDNEYNRAVRYGTSYSIIIIDIDHFKAVNDNFGHQTGDKVLQELSMTLKNSVRSVDTVGRWGGEEFVIISPESDLNSVKKLAEKLRDKVENYEFPVVKNKTISLGVATSTKDDSIDELIKRADDNLYKAKNSGRNRVCWE